jgi:hypothetical protein
MRPPNFDRDAAQRAARARWGDAGVALDLGPTEGSRRYAVGVRYTLHGRPLVTIAYGRGRTWEAAFRDCDTAGIEPISRGE